MHLYYGYDQEVDLPPLKEKADKKLLPGKGRWREATEGSLTSKHILMFVTPPPFQGTSPFRGGVQIKYFKRHLFFHKKTVQEVCTVYGLSVDMFLLQSTLCLSQQGLLPIDDVDAL
ncbi:MAG: hypothetical protein II801_04415, partial [Bacteroidaceae bacterium]|nr:hypothetical protein [Bacteroidaceae bacterium]